MGAPSAAFRMASQGASLQNYNNELVKCIEDLNEKREEVNRQILQDEEEKQKIQNDLRILTERCLLPRAVSQMSWECRLTVFACPKCRLRQALAHQRLPARKVASRNEYDKTIMETEAAYMKILESSQTLLHVLKRESTSLTKKKQASS